MKEKVLRPINEFEKKLINETFFQISINVSSLAPDLGDLVFILLDPSQQEFPKMFLIPKDLHKIISNLESNKKISVAGIYFGFIKKGEFFISLEGTEFLYNNAAFSDEKQLIVNENGEKSTLYGNHILKEMIEKVPKSFQKNDFLVVLNQKQELIAISNAQCDSLLYNDLKPKEIVAKNLTDKGYYLRKKQ